VADRSVSVPMTMRDQGTKFCGRSPELRSNGLTYDRVKFMLSTVSIVP